MQLTPEHARSSSPVQLLTPAGGNYPNKSTPNMCRFSLGLRFRNLEESYHRVPNAGSRVDLDSRLLALVTQFLGDYGS